MNLVIYYFSGTGNTWFVADYLRKTLIEKGGSVELHTIEESGLMDARVLKEQIGQADKVIIGYPIYGSKAPKMMEDFLVCLPQNNGKSISVFTTVALFSGDGPIAYKSLLREKGYTLETAMEFIMNNNFNVPGFPDTLHVGDSQRIEKRHRKVLPRINQMAEKIITGHKRVQGRSPLHRVVGHVQRAHVDKYIQKVGDTLLVDESKCTLCKKCVKICPAHNIIDMDGRIVFQNQCMACIRCYHQCPTEAINITKESQDNQHWKRFKGVYKEFEKSLMTTK